MSGSDPNDWLFGERMMGVAKHCLGDQISARRHLEQVLTDYVATHYRADVIGSVTDLHVVRFHTDLRISARVYIARALWLQGFSDQAMRTAEISIEEAPSAPVTHYRCAMRSPWRHARSRCGWETSPPPRIIC